jgi:hypothetical protein
MPISFGRFKEDIKSMDRASEAILALKPVTFRYKKEFDPKGIRQFGLVAEEVEKTNPDLVKRDRDGKLQTVRYDAVNAMLLNEFLKEHRKVQEQANTIAEVKDEIANLTAIVKDQTTQIQKVTAQLESTEAAVRIVVNDQ